MSRIKFIGNPSPERESSYDATDLNKSSRAFTLVEVLLSITIISTMIIIGFYALSFITIGKVRLVENTKIQKEAFYFSEKLFEMIKRGWVIDFEEYFNRDQLEATNQFTAWHFQNLTGFWNFWRGWVVGDSSQYWSSIYYCVSPDSWPMWENWCMGTNNANTLSLTGTVLRDIDYQNSPQRYWQYAQNFLDYNADTDENFWDEDGDNRIDLDDDDEYLGQWPIVFWTWANLHELYLNSQQWSKRTMFRWTVIEDPDKPASDNCDLTSDASTPTGTGCLGTIEFIELDARDWWHNHDTSVEDADGSQYDWIIDTWIVNSKFSGNNTTVFGSNTTNYWQSLFPDSITVENFQVFAYPNKDIDLAWKDWNSDVNQSPYVRISMTIKPSWKNRKKIRWKIPEVTIATTIALNDTFSQ